MTQGWWGTALAAACMIALQLPSVNDHTAVHAYDHSGLLLLAGAACLACGVVLVVGYIS